MGSILGADMKPVPVAAESRHMTPVQNAAFILFHELGHLANIYGKNDKDADNNAAVDADNKLIMDNCFKDIKK